MTSMYKDEEPAYSLIEAGAKEPVESKTELAKFCLMMSHLERCYAEQNQHRDPEQTLALEIYRAMERNRQKLTKGILKTVTMIN